MMQNCIQQSFDTPTHVNVSENTTLSENFIVNIHNYLAAISAKLGTYSCCFCMSVL